MKILIKSKIALLLLFVGIASSCKKNDAAVDSPYVDSTATSIQSTTDTTHL